MTTGNPLNPDQLARAAAALDAWFGPGPGVPGGPGMTWCHQELESMHAALEAHDIDTALEAFPGAPGSWLSTPEQDAGNRTLMAGLRQALVPEPAAAAAQADLEPELEAE
jgi:hypothetical protein